MMKIVIRAEMADRWVPHFRGMLDYMEQLGKLGASRTVSFYADGDGDFRPHFTWAEGLPEPAGPRRDDGGDRLYDTG
jgi:hypothetical protein